jgi:predicted RNA-binding protein with RPS1 domain
VSEAEEGQAAAEQAIDVLDHFYKTAAKATVLAQATSSGVDDVLPDTGFEGANTGSQGVATGVLGMLDVIKSDFIRTIKETEKMEKNAETEFIEFERTTKVSITTKKSTKTSNEAEEAATITEISNAISIMKEEQTLLDKALQELEEPRPACIDTGMSYEERVARCEQEIDITCMAWAIGLRDATPICWCPLLNDDLRLTTSQSLTQQIGGGDEDETGPVDLLI